MNNDLTREDYECLFQEIFAILVDDPSVDEQIKQDIKGHVMSGLVSRCLRSPDDEVENLYVTDDDNSDADDVEEFNDSDDVEERDLELADKIWCGHPIDYKDIYYFILARVLDLMFSRNVSNINDFSFAIRQIEKTIMGQGVNSSTKSIVWFLADIYSVLGRYQEALEIFQALLQHYDSDDSNHQLVIRIINLKRKANVPIEGIDLLRLVRPSKFNLTRHEFDGLLQKGKNYLNLLVNEVLSHKNYICQILDATTQGVVTLFSGIPSLRRFLEEHKTQLIESDMEVPDINEYDESLFAVIESLYRDIKLIGIQSRDVCNIEKDWESSVKLYKQLKDTFPTERIIYHYSTPWLWKFTLALYFPDRNLAFDYRGREVMNPKNYHGGISAQNEYFRLYDRTVFKATKEYGIYVIRVGADVPYDEIFDYVCKAIPQSD